LRTKIVTAVVVLFAVVVLVAYWDQPWPLMRVAGAVVFAVGLAMWTMARVQLGASFSVQAKAKRLVTTGVYSRIRNPIYIAGQMMFVGAALFVPSWIPMVVVALTVPMQVVRARKEAEVLHEAFGEEYEAYRLRTWF
jgi:protein-S-isoprenylcysteine O-methyltransferase Ste14